MKWEEVAILLGCYTFEDFPTFHTGEDADNLLASWSALWHPQLIHTVQKVPTWHRIDALPSHDRSRLLVLPTTQEVEGLEKLRDDVVQSGGLLIEQGVTPHEIAAAAMEGAGLQETVTLDLVTDFYALGFAFLQIQLLTRHMRYATQMSETAFETTLIAAAGDAVEGRDDVAREGLQACFDFLSQERDHYYAVDIYLLDVAMLAEPLLGEALQRQCQTTHAFNLLTTAELLQSISEHHGSSASALRACSDDNRLGLIGGEYREYPTTLLSVETLRTQLELGRETFQNALQRFPKVYGRRTFGLAPVLPQLLLKYGFDGALHATFDGGQFPEATQAKSRWEGDGQFSLDAITRSPSDATKTETYLALAQSLSESMDMDHIATRGFVHWVGEANPWFELLQRATKYTPALGRFVTVEEYFDQTYDPGIHDQFLADQYRSPWLSQQVAASAPDVISQWSRYWRELTLLQCGVSFRAWHALVAPGAETRDAYEQAAESLRRFQGSPLNGPDVSSPKDSQQRLDESVRDLASALRGQSPFTETQQESDAVQGYLVFNPFSFARRISIDDAKVSPAEEAPVYAVETSSDGTRVAVDVPGCGWASVRPQTSARTSSTRKSLPPLGEENRLRNEFFEAIVDPATGALRAIRDYGSRTNRLSQQLGMRRQASSTSTPQYSTMVADSLELLEANAMIGRIETRGRLIHDDQSVVAHFTQQYQVRRGSRVLELTIHLEPEVELDSRPWDEYFACRIAWSNEAADLSRSLSGNRQTTSAKRIEAPLFLEVADGAQRTALLTGGLPFHRRVGRRMVDTLLIVRGETARDFSLGIGVELKQPFREALSLVAPETILPCDASAMPSAAWLFHLDARHVYAESWQPLWEGDNLVGVSVRLIECEGRSGTVVLRTLRAVGRARKTDAMGQTVDECRVDGDQVTCRISPREIVDLDLRFATT